MDDFKKANTNEATGWDLKCPGCVKRKTKYKKKLHKLSRSRLKRNLKKEIEAKDE